MVQIHPTVLVGGTLTLVQVVHKQLLIQVQDSLQSFQISLQSFHQMVVLCIDHGHNDIVPW